MRKFAKIISRSFDFYTWFPVLLFVSIFNTGLAAEQIKILLPALLSIEVILPVLLFLWVLKTGRISDIDVTKRAERPKLFGVMTLLALVSTVISFLIANQLFFVLQLATLLICVLNFLITLKWKISGHMVMNNASILIINFLFDWKLLWLFAIVPVVAFARIYLKKHTPAQVLAGAVVGLTEPYLILKIFKLI